MTVGELKKLLSEVPDSMEVVVRVQGELAVSDFEANVVIVGGVTGARPDAGCTETEVFMIDGDEQEGADGDEAAES